VEIGLGIHACRMISVYSYHLQGEEHRRPHDTGLLGTPGGGNLTGGGTGARATTTMGPFGRHTYRLAGSPECAQRQWVRRNLGRVRVTTLAQGHGSSTREPEVLQVRGRAFGATIDTFPEIGRAGMGFGGGRRPWGGQRRVSTSGWDSQGVPAAGGEAHRYARYSKGRRRRGG
jgi:hypothetical protein